MKDVLLQQGDRRIDCEVDSLKLTFTHSDEPKVHYTLMLRDEKAYNALKSHHKGRPIRIVETGRVYPSIKACAEDLNTYGPEISRCLSGDRSTYRGYHFEYVDKEAYNDGCY